MKDCTPLSVVDVRAAFRDGRIKLEASAGGGGPVDLNTLVFEADTVLLDEQPLRPRTRHFAAVLNKPQATISTARDPRGKGDLRRWLALMPPGTFPVGRLDRDTTGLLLFTTDGDLANAVLRPEHHTDKLYWLWLNEEFEESDARLSLLTVTTDPRYDGAARAEVTHRTLHHVEIHLTLNQGKHRQIRRMCRALNLRLHHLHRKRIGPLNDTGLAVGEFRELSEAEVNALWDATGGRATLTQRKIRALGKLAASLRQQGAPHPALEQWLDEHVRSEAAAQPDCREAMTRG